MRWVFPLLAVLVLSACSSMASLADRVVLQPLGQVVRAVGVGTGHAGDACTRLASQVNPATLAPGLGGTGAPASSAAAHPGGLGGTGQVAQRPGLGGTGQVAQRPGLGGTGQVAEGGLGGTGIVGVVTGFGSICVNGVKVDVDGDTPVQRDGRPSSLNELAVGQVVALRAQGEGERFRAERIAVLDAVVGPLGMLERSTGRLEVMGQRVTALEPQDLAGIAVGDWVRVSGQRRADGEIRATRVQVVPPGDALLVGSASRTPDGWRIGDARLELASSVSTASWREGGELRVKGRWTGDRLQVRDAQTDPTRNAMGSISEVVLQGYVHELRGRELSLGFESLSLANVLKVLGGQVDALRAGQPVLVRGRIDAQQRVVVDQLEFRNEGRRGGGRSGRSSRDDRDSDDSSNSGSSSSGSGSGDSGGQGRGRGRGRGGD